MDYLSQLNSAKDGLISQLGEYQNEAQAYLNNSQDYLQSKIDDYADKMEIGEKLQSAGEFLVGALEIGKRAKGFYDTIKNKGKSQEETQDNESQPQQEEQLQSGDREMTTMEETPDTAQTNEPPSVQETNIDQAMEEEAMPADATPSMNAGPVDENSADIAPAEDTTGEIGAEIGAETGAETGAEIGAEVGGEVAAGAAETIAGAALEAVPVVGEIIGAGLAIAGIFTSIFEGDKERVAEENEQAIQEADARMGPINTQILSSVGQTTSQLVDSASSVLNYII